MPGGSKDWNSLPSIASGAVEAPRSERSLPPKI
jgi:hypothetical protein